MTASLRVKNDKYYVVLTHTTDGKKNQTWVSTGLSVTGNEGKARQIMLDMLGEKPEQAAPHDILFSDAVRRWLEDVRHRVDEVTYQGYEVQARAHILPLYPVPAIASPAFSEIHRRRIKHRPGLHRGSKDHPSAAAARMRPQTP